MRHVVRALFWTLLRLIYRIRVRGMKNIPKGACILAPNHVTYIDAVLIAAHVRRPVNFAMYWRIYDKFKWAVAPMGAFPIAGKNERRDIYDDAFAHMEAALGRGEIVCIFPEGKLTTDGQMNPFQNGILKVLSRNPVPVVPVALCNLWGSYFSRKQTGVFKLPDHFMAKITMVVGKPVSPGTPLEEIERAVRGLV